METLLLFQQSLLLEVEVVEHPLLVKCQVILVDRAVEVELMVRVQVHNLAALVILLLLVLLKEILVDLPQVLVLHGLVVLEGALALRVVITLQVVQEQLQQLMLPLLHEVVVVEKDLLL
jgi:hypothetical protein